MFLNTPNSDSHQIVEDEIFAPHGLPAIPLLSHSLSPKKGLKILPGSEMGWVQPQGLMHISHEFENTLILWQCQVQ